MTDKSVEIVEGLVVRAPTNGRRTYSETAKRALVQLSMRPGVSVAGLALAHGINANLLRRWMTQFGPESKAGNAASAGAPLLPVNRSTAATLRAPLSTDCCIEFSFMGATIRVRGRSGRAGPRCRAGLPGAACVIGLPTNTQVWLAAGVTDMRRGMHSLAAVVQTTLLSEPFSGHIFAFRGRRGDLVKLLWWSGDGLCLFIKKLERGKFVWPLATSGTVHLTGAQLSMLLEGINWKRPERTWQPQVMV